MLNHTGELNAGALVHEQVGELVAERTGFGVVGEVSTTSAPERDRVDDTIDHITQRGLTLGGARGATEVLLGDDVRGVERPVGRELHVFLLERDRAVDSVHDPSVAAFPGDLVVGMSIRCGEVATDTDARCGGRLGHAQVLSYATCARNAGSRPVLVSDCWSRRGR